MTQVSVRCAILAALLSSAATALEMPSPPAVGLYLDFEKPTPSATIESMKAEVERILAPSGLRLEWQMLQDPRGGQNFADLAVVRFHGVCSIPDDAGTDWDIKPFPPLASTQVVDGHVLPYTDVACGTIARYIGTLAGSAGVTREQIFGRALGRVVAHELYHVFSGTRKHAADGVARAYHTRKELVAKEFNFQEAESEMFRAIRTRMESSAMTASAPVRVETSASAEGGGTAFAR